MPSFLNRAKDTLQNECLKPLHFAIITLNVAEVIRLIEKGENINEPAILLNGMTPLMLAALIGSPKIVAHLLMAGADGNMRDMSSKNALDNALEGPWCLDRKSFETIKRCLSISLPFLRAAKWIGAFKQHPTIKPEEKLNAIEQISWNFLF